MKKRYNTIVLGLGAMGSAAAFQLAKRGKKVLGIDQFSPPHRNGSSHGDTRITRQAIGEGEQYTPLALRSYEIWGEIERETGRKLLEKCGGLIISSGAKTAVNHVANFFENTIAAANKFGIKHETLNADQVRARFPQFNIRDNEMAYFEPEAGFLRPEVCIEAQLELANKYGAEIHENEKVLSFVEVDGVVTVTTDKAEYEADSLIVSAGPWLPTFLSQEYAQYFTVVRQVLYWFEITAPVEQYAHDKLPVFIWELQGNTQGVYGFPAIDGPSGGLKIATEQYGVETTVDTVNREVGEEEVRLMYQDFVAPYFPGLSDTCIKAVSCLYTVTPDSHFVIDKHPQYPSVVIASPCSGHGFKHSAAIGEVLAQMVTDGKTTIDIECFSLRRFKSINISER